MQIRFLIYNPCVYLIKKVQNFICSSECCCYRHKQYKNCTANNDF